MPGVGAIGGIDVGGDGRVPVNVGKRECDRLATGARGVVDGRLHGALGADALAVGAGERAPAAVRVMQTFGTLRERAARGGTLIFVRFRENEPAHASGAVDRLIRRRYTLAQVSRPVTFGESAFPAFGAKTRRAIRIRVTSTRTFFLLSLTNCRRSGLLH